MKARVIYAHLFMPRCTRICHCSHHAQVTLYAWSSTASHLPQVLASKATIFGLTLRRRTPVRCFTLHVGIQLRSTRSNPCSRRPSTKPTSMSTFFRNGLEKHRYCNNCACPAHLHLVTALARSLPYSSAALHIATPRILKRCARGRYSSAAQAHHLRRQR